MTSCEHDAWHEPLPPDCVVSSPSSGGTEESAWRHYSDVHDYCLSRSCSCSLSSPHRRRIGLPVLASEMSAWESVGVRSGEGRFERTFEEERRPWLFLQRSFPLHSPLRAFLVVAPCHRLAGATPKLPPFFFISHSECREIARLRCLRQNPSPTRVTLPLDDEENARTMKLRLAFVVVVGASRFLPPPPRKGDSGGLPSIFVFSCFGAAASKACRSSGIPALVMLSGDVSGECCASGSSDLADLADLDESLTSNSDDSAEATLFMAAADEPTDRTATCCWASEPEISDDDRLTAP